MTRRNLPGGLTVALVLIVVPGLALLGLQTYQIRARAPQVANDRKLLVHTFEVISAAQALATAVRDAERGQRRYLLSGERSYLEVYEGAARDVPTLLAKLKSLTRDNPEQQRRLPNLEHQLDLELGELARTLQLSTHDGFSAVQQFLRTDAHSDAVVVIDGLIEAAIATERSLLAERLGEHIAMETVLASGLWTVAADTSQLETALLNLAVNARDAIPQSGKLTIETAPSG